MTIFFFSELFLYFFFFFFNDTATTEIYTLSLHDALPIYHGLRDLCRGQALPVHGKQIRNGVLPRQLRLDAASAVSAKRHPAIWIVHELCQSARKGSFVVRRDVGRGAAGGEPMLRQIKRNDWLAQ